MNYIKYEQDEIYSKLNSEQTKAFSELVKFINLLQLNKDKGLSSNPLYFLLNGPGGSGKTYLISNLIDLLDSTGLRFQVLAPTHKACNVIRQSLVGVDVDTVAKFLGYTSDIDNDGETIVTYKWFEKPEIYKDDLLIIDECSMISKDQLEVLKHTKINIIYVGDFCQINPVGEPISDVFNLDFYGTGTLVKNERIKDENLAAIILDYRESVIKNHISKKCLVNTCRISSREAFNKLLIESFLNNPDTIYIAYSNSQVKLYNDLIRKNLFSNTTDSYVSGERLIFSTFYVADSKKYYTSQKVKIEKCQKVTLYLNCPKCVCSKKFKTNFINEVEPPSIERIEKCIKCHTPPSIVSYKPFQFWSLQIEGSNESFYKPVEGMKEIYPILYKYRDRAKALKNKYVWADYYKFQNMLNVPLEYSYCITVHKSQGSGYQNVFVDMENIFWCKDEAEKLRLAYTAISRSQSSVYFFK